MELIGMPEEENRSFLFLNENDLEQIIKKLKAKNILPKRFNEYSEELNSDEAKEIIDEYMSNHCKYNLEQLGFYDIEEDIADGLNDIILNKKSLNTQLISDFNYINSYINDSDHIAAIYKDYGSIGSIDNNLIKIFNLVTYNSDENDGITFRLNAFHTKYDTDMEFAALTECDEDNEGANTFINKAMNKLTAQELSMLTFDSCNYDLEDKFDMDESPFSIHITFKATDITNIKECKNLIDKVYSICKSMGKPVDNNKIIMAEPAARQGVEYF